MVDVTKAWWWWWWQSSPPSSSLVALNADKGMVNSFKAEQQTWICIALSPDRHDDHNHQLYVLYVFCVEVEILKHGISVLRNHIRVHLLSRVTCEFHCHVLLWSLTEEILKMWSKSMILSRSRGSKRICILMHIGTLGIYQTFYTWHNHLKYISKIYILKHTESLLTVFFKRFAS